MKSGKSTFIIVGTIIVVAVGLWVLGRGSRADRRVFSPPVRMRAADSAAFDAYREHIKIAFEMREKPQWTDTRRFPHINGTVTNNGDRTIADLDFIVVLYNAEGFPIYKTSMVMGYYIDQRVIPPGATVGFTGGFDYESSLNPAEIRCVLESYSFAD